MDLTVSLLNDVGGEISIIVPVVLLFLCNYPRCMWNVRECVPNQISLIQLTADFLTTSLLK